MEFKRGQAAMEYLMTYGWAILVIVIVLAALLYLGIFNLNPPEVCTMPAGMTCPKDYLTAGPATYVAGASALNITLVNGLQKTIVITGVAASQKNDTHFQTCQASGWSDTVITCPGFDATAGGTIVPLGGSFSVQLKPFDTAGAPMAIASGDAFSGKINVRYYFKDEGSSSIRRLSGNVYAKAS